MSDDGAGDLFTGGSKAGAAGRGAGLTEKVARGEEPVGKRRPLYDARKLHYDVLGARSEKGMSWTVTKSDCMSAQQAGETMTRILDKQGLARGQPEVIGSFLDAMFFCVAVNGTSQLVDSTAKFRVKNTEFSLQEIFTWLGPDVRRFFRAYADEIRDVVRVVLSREDPSDLESVDMAELVRRVAMDKGLFRHPELIADVSECCKQLSPTERSAIAASKRDVLASGFNAVDRVSTGARVASRDNYDSTNKTHMGSMML